MDMKPIKPTKALATEGEGDDLRLTADRIAEIRADAQKKVRAEKTKQLEAAEMARAMEEIRGKEGQLTGDPDEDRIVSLTVRMADDAPGPTINGRKYEHGRTYEVPVHVARTLMDIAYRTEVSAQMITDKPLLAFYQRPRMTVISPRKGVVGGPERPDGSLVQ